MIPRPPLQSCRLAGLIPLALMLVFTGWGCGGRSNQLPHELESTPHKHLPAMRHTIQVGAFSSLNNAVRFTERLRAKGINAYHFRHDTGLYKVRFGNFASREAARSKAEKLNSIGLIENYYIVGPKDFPARSRPTGDTEHLRNRIVSTAQRYIGVPYRWGGESPGTGFDCSGLTMVVYRLNGLDLPRASGQQFQAGTPVKRGQLAKGDLVFFATAGGSRVSHVGIYVGNGNFLHAPGKGRTIRLSPLSNTYYKTRYLGARSYL